MNNRFVFDVCKRNTKMTTQQWAKRILAILAKENAASISAHLKDLTESDQEAVKTEFDRIVHKLLTRQGFVLETRSVKK